MKGIPRHEYTEPKAALNRGNVTCYSAYFVTCVHHRLDHFASSSIPSILRSTSPQTVPCVMVW